jgi:LETM1-like protein
MINPSIHGWIDKYFIDRKTEFNSITPNDFYFKLRQSGFLFGNTISLGSHFELENKNWLKGEMSKVYLLDSLYNIYIFSTKKIAEAEFIKIVVHFYEEINPHRFNLLNKILPKNSVSTNLENIIDERIHINENVISKNFSNLVTNAFLFVDVLAFQHYLINDSISEKYLKSIEETILSIISFALKTKSKKSEHDDLLVKLFETSLRYGKSSNFETNNLDSINLEYFTNDFEKKYFIDLTSLALWNDGKIENEEHFFLLKLAEKLSISEDFVDESIKETHDFIIKNRNEIPYFNKSNVVKSFYEQTTNKVSTLILRNKKRLAKEISQSKELMILLAISTKRDLDESEKKKVKSQLLDICKTIPSLTLFLIPGGSLLLPILIKFIPQLLPSSFNENLEEK